MPHGRSNWRNMSQLWSWGGHGLADACCDLFLVDVTAVSNLIAAGCCFRQSACGLSARLVTGIFGGHLSVGGLGFCKGFTAIRVAALPSPCGVECSTFLALALLGVHGSTASVLVMCSPPGLLMLKLWWGSRNA